MPQYVTVTMDGADYRALKGTSVLDTAIEYGICIPHLCHVPGLSDYGACRLCIVEHIVNGCSKVTTSCTLHVEEGMVIATNTERIRRLRHNLAELLVAQAPNSRAVQDIAVRCGVTSVRYEFRNDNCVQCGRCVRVCAEVWRAHALGFVGRGKERHRDFAFGVRPETCKECDSCIMLCPMTLPPCDGPMTEGEGRLCGHCESQLLLAEELHPGACIWCRLGEGFGCGRYAGAPLAGARSR